MNMQVETFEQTEMTAEGQEEAVNSEAKALIESMGLEGQKSLMIDTNERCPYREMSAEEKNVYNVLFPEQTKVQSYKYGFIPLRVLQIAAHADSMGIYKEIQVWSEQVKPTDPILVGKIDNGVYHILARWGEALESFDKLKEKAITRAFEKKKASLQRQIAQSTQELSSLSRESIASSLTDRYFYV